MSLRIRLLLAVGAVALIALVIADVVTYQELRSFLYSRIDQSLEQSHMPIENALRGFAPRGPSGGAPFVPSTGGPTGEVGLPPSSSPSSTLVSSSSRSAQSGDGTTSGQLTSCTDFGLPDVLLRQLPAGAFVEVRRASNAILCSSTETELGATQSTPPALPPRVTGFVSNAADFGEKTVYFTAAAGKSEGTPYRMRASVLDAGPYTGGQLLVGVPLRSTLSTLNRLLGVELAVTGAGLAAALLLGWWLVRVSFRPLRAVEATAEAIARGELAERVPGDGARTEVGRLARALNVMLGRIENAFAERDATENELRDSEGRMRQFVADASHELRTPLAAVSAYAELFEQGAAAHPDDLERAMHGIRNESARMGHLVEDLLLLARLDEGRPLDRDEVELVGVAAEAVQTASTVGPQWPVQLVARHPVEITGDKLRLRQVVDNLLANVRTHCPQGTSSVVTVDQDDRDAVITVSDDGPGLSADDATRVFERFFRADVSRSRRHGGAGLGLSIVASITKAHGGTVAAAPAPGGGTMFTVRLPLPTDADPGEPVPGPTSRGFTGDS